MGRHPRTFSSIILAALFCESISSAQPAAPDSAADRNPEADRGVSSSEVAPKEKKAIETLPWRGTLVSWDQTATAQTVGIGKNYQSANPTYDWTFSFEPSLYVYDDDVNRVRVGGSVGVYHEFTNSDATTKQGETSFSGGVTGGSDAMVFSQYSRTLYEQDRVKTALGWYVPMVTFPTSKASADAGVILGLGTELKLRQAFPLLPGGGGFLESGSVDLLGGYTHRFTRATVSVNPDLQRVRLDTNGLSVPGDQLDGTPFAEHQVLLGVLPKFALTDRLTLSTGFLWLLAWKYPLATPVEICGVTATGCTPAQEPTDPQRFAVTTEFTTELDVSLFDELDLRASYDNTSLQIGPDGTRRNMFYSPDSRVALGVVVNLDALYLRASGVDPSGPATPSGGKTARRSTSSSVE